MTSIVTTGAIFANTAIANADDKYSDALHAKTQSDLTFIKSDAPTPPTPPGPEPDPDKKPNPTPNPIGGELMLSYTPDLKFGTQLKSDTTFFARADKGSNGNEFLPFISVEDNRGSERKGWTLTAKQDAPFQSKDGKKELKGATITFSNLFYDARTGAPKAASSEIVLSTQTQELATSDTTNGVGAWSLGLGSKLEEGIVDYTADKDGKMTPVKGQVTKGVKLSIPSTSVKESATYSTTITYELIADPTA